MTPKVVFLPSVTPCETCELEAAQLLVDGVWICEACAGVLGVSPAGMQTPAPREVKPAGPSLHETINTVLRGRP